MNVHTKPARSFGQTLWRRLVYYDGIVCCALYSKDKK